MEIKIPFKTPTINHLYGQRGFRKFLKPEAKKLREEITNLCKVRSEELERLWCMQLEVEVKIYENWFTTTGEIKRKDVANREKFLIDSVFNALGIDDKQIFKHTMKKVQSDEEFAIIKIEQLKKNVK